MPNCTPELKNKYFKFYYCITMCIILKYCDLSQNYNVNGVIKRVSLK